MKAVGRLFLVCVLATVGLNACDDSSSDDTPKDDDVSVVDPAIKDQCIDSGGVFDEGRQRCICQGNICDSGIVCDVSTKLCFWAIPHTCISGSETCRNGAYYVCGEDGTWTFSEECASKYCLDNNTNCMVCNENEIKCKNDKLSKCVDNDWDVLQRCQNGCAPDGKSCVHVCDEGQTKCESSEKYKCDNNNWIPIEKCTDGCAPDGLNCKKECENDQLKCEASVSYKCIENKWVVQDECKKGCNTSTNQCSNVCDEGKTRCEATVLYKCTNDNWVKEKVCDYGCDTNENICRLGCSPGEMRCKDGEDGIGMIAKCVNDEFSTWEKCPNDASCRDDQHCGECRNGNGCYLDGSGRYSYDNDVLTTCRNGVLTHKDCPVSGDTHLYCNKDNTACNKICRKNERRCINNSDKVGVLQHCDEYNVFVKDGLCSGACNKAGTGCE